MVTPDADAGYRQALKVFDVVRKLARDFELREILEQIIDAGREMLRADRASILLYDAAHNELYSKATSAREELRFAATSGIAGETISGRKIIRIDDCYADPRFNPEVDRATGYRTTSMISVPLIGLGDEVVGVLQALNAQEGTFSPGDERLADLFAGFAALAIQRAQAFRSRIQQEKRDQELSLAREIQQGIVPTDFPVRTEFDAHGILHPAREVGGDFYDLFLVGDSRVAFCIGDVSGKGVPAALFMAVTKTMIKTRASYDPSPAGIFGYANSQLARDNKESMFVTAFIGILEIETGSFRYCNAGHNPPFIKRADGSLLRLDHRHGPVLGAVEDLQYGEDEEALHPGDSLFLYTDGVTEAMNSQQKLYSEARLYEVLTTLGSQSAQGAVREQVTDVSKFRGRAEQTDDITIMTLRYSGPAAAGSSDRLRITIGNRLEEIASVQEQLNEFSLLHGVPDEARRNIDLAFDELLTNIVSYAYEDDGTHEIDIEVVLTEGRLVATISDDGKPFNPFDIRTPDTWLPIEDRPVGGLGVHLVRKTMDHTSYERRGSQNIVLLEKQLESPEE